MFAKEWDFHVFIFVTLSMKKILIMIINFMNVLSSNLWGVFLFVRVIFLKEREVFDFKVYPKHKIWNSLMVHIYTR